MRYAIASDLPGRLSLRLGCGCLEQDEARGIAVALLGVAGVREAEVHAANGAAIVAYGASARPRVLALLDELDVLDLPAIGEDDPLVPQQVELTFERNHFGFEVASLVTGQLLRRYALPAPLRAAYTLWRSLRFVCAGLLQLAHGRVGVEVLDAAAIATSLMQGSFDDASAVMLLLDLTDAMERHVQRRVRMALAQNLITRPEHVWQVVDGQDVSIPLEQVRKGQVLHMGAGQVLPVDGTVCEGEGEVNEASLTGEPDLVRKSPGKTVYAGTALEAGDLRVLVTAEPGKARIDGIAAMVEESSERKAGVQSRAEHLADALVPVSFAAFFGILGVTRSLATAMTVLMVDYSCAVRVATPISVMAAMAEAARRDVVVKGGKYLEALAEADVVVFDKTGTLTCAVPSVCRVLSFGTMREDEILRYAACIEEHFPHSVARAIVMAARERGLEHTHELHAEVRYVVAHGIRTEIGGRTACIGSAHFLFEDEGVPVPDGLKERIAAEAGSSSVVFFALDHKLEGAVCLDDPLRPEASAVVACLREQGFERVIMLTGDSEDCAASIAAQVGVDEYRAQVLPEDKSSLIRELRRAGHTVLMVGDGINDSPALATANVSVALSDASDIARAVADICVMDASLEQVITMRELACALMRRIHADYRFIVSFNTALIAAGVAGLLPVTAAAYLHNGSTLAIAISSSRRYALRGAAVHGPASRLLP